MRRYRHCSPSDFVVVNKHFPQGVRPATKEDLCGKGLQRGDKLAKAVEYARLVPKEKVRVGCVVEFQRDFSFFSVPGFAGGLMKLLNRKWNGYGWHVGWVTGINPIRIVEAIGFGVHERPIDKFYEKRNYRFWDILPESIPTEEQVTDVLDAYEGKPYDFLAYFWTAMLYLGRHYINRPLPSVLNDKYMCWELIYDICRYVGYPLAANDYDCPTLTELNLVCRGLLYPTKKEKKYEVSLQSQCRWRHRP